MELVFHALGTVKDEITNVVSLIQAMPFPRSCVAEGCIADPSNVFHCSFVAEGCIADPSNVFSHSRVALWR